MSNSIHNNLSSNGSDQNTQSPDNRKENIIFQDLFSFAESQPTNSKKTISFSGLVKQIKAANEDFEFYPTTSDIAQRIYTQLDNCTSILDVGAGSGIFFSLLEKIDAKQKETDQYYSCKVGDKYAIEKSKILIDNMPKDVALVGTDFNNQTLIDKSVDVVFSNPPYSQAEEWTNKIIRESNCSDAFIVIPVTKWEKSERIKEALEIRNASFERIMKYDYRDSEYRKARTVVGVYKISFYTYAYGRRTSNTDPFNAWFNENFKIEEKGKTKSFDERLEELEKSSEVVKGKNLIERLVVMYNEDMCTINTTYKSIAQIPAELLDELNISKESILKSLKMKIKNTKNRYWQELYKNLDVVISKLTNQSRQRIIEKLTSSTNVDFSEENAYAVICWTLKNANSYFDTQLVDVYQDITKQKNVKPYKSNHRFKTDDFRYYKDENTHYKLDYRIIIPSSVSLYSYGSPDKLDDYNNRYIYEKLQDIFTIANNLGFSLGDPIPVENWKYGEEREIYGKDDEVLAAIRIFKNGNIHIKCNVKFMKAFNVEAGRLLGWLKTPQQAAEELEIEPEECLKFFESNISLTQSDIKLLA